MKIMIAPLIKELMELYLIDDYLTSIFYFDHDQGVGLFTSTIIRFEYNDTRSNNLTDDELNECLLDYVTEFLETTHGLDLIILSHIHVIPKVAIVLRDQFPEISIIETTFPENKHDLNQDTILHRTTSHDVENFAEEREYFFPFIAELLEKTPIEGSLDSLRNTKANLN